MKKALSFIIVVIVIFTVFLAWKNVKSNNSARVESSVAVPNNGSAGLATNGSVSGNTLTASGEVSKTIENFAKRLNEVAQSNTWSDADFEAFVSGLKPADAKELREMATNQKLAHNSRFLAVYALSKRADIFLEQLTQIAASNTDLLGQYPGPHTAGLLDKNFEVSVRIEAMKGIDATNPVDGAKNTAEFEKISNLTKSDTLKRLARIGYVGAKRGEALLNKYVEEKTEGAVR